MNSKHKARLEQIRERARETPHYFTADFHFLLSLIESEAVKRIEPYSAKCRAAIDELERRFESEGVELCSIEYAHQRENHVATTMRDLCVEKVKTIRHGHGFSNNQDYEYGYEAALDEVKAALKTAALDQVEQKPK